MVTKKFIDRERTNILASIEQPTLIFLCNIFPNWLTPNILTLIGFSGAFIISFSFYFAIGDVRYLWLAVLGFGIQWFGDSLDGRIAYFRNTPRKWFGFTLDMVVDWISIIIIGIGFYLYVPATKGIFVYTFICMYGWTMIIALIKYKVTGSYVIDSGKLGPTELRLILCLLIIAEIYIGGILATFAVVINFILFALNAVDFYKLLKSADERDKTEKSTSS